MHLGNRNQIAVTAAAFVGFTGSTLVMPFLALYIQQLGVTDTGDVALWTGLTLGSTPAITAACAPFWGRVADRFGNKILVQRSLLSFVVVMGAMAFVTSPWQLFALRAAQGFVAGYGPLTLSMAALSVPRDRMASAIGAVQTAQRIGPAIGPVIGGVLAGAVGQRNAFLVAASVYAVAFVLLTVLYQEPRHQAAEASASPARVSFRDILALENFVLLTGLILGMQLVERSFGPVLPLFVATLGVAGGRAEVGSGIIFSALALAGAAGHQLAGALLKRMSARAVLSSALVGAAAALLLFAVSHSLALLIVTMAGVGLGIGTAATSAYAAAGSVIPRRAHGASFGFLTSAQLMGMSLGPVVGGLVAARSIRVVFIAGAVALLLLALVIRHVMVDRAPALERVPPVEEA
jgi:DHA1 family multidrug resistance protein-like MFS transporter